MNSVAGPGDGRAGCTNAFVPSSSPIAPGLSFDAKAVSWASFSKNGVGDRILYSGILKSDAPLTVVAKFCGQKGYNMSGESPGSGMNCGFLDVSKASGRLNRICRRGERW